MLHAIETEQQKSRKNTRIGDTMDAMKSWTPLAPGTALPLDRPWVFLESTVIARGLPWPENLERQRWRWRPRCKHPERFQRCLQRPPCRTGRRRVFRLKSRGPAKSRERRARTHASERKRSQAP